MYRSLLGDGFDRLPEAIRAVHRGDGDAVFEGRCEIRRGTGLLSRAIAAAARLPAPGTDVPLRVHVRRTPRGETWTREFAGRPMRSALSARGGVLHERMGPATFRFALRPVDDTLHWDLVGVSALGLPLPLAWFRGVRASEAGADGAYRFDVRASLPLAGLLVHYRGELRARA